MILEHGGRRLFHLQEQRILLIATLEQDDERLRCQSIVRLALREGSDPEPSRPSTSP
jgi:hypothetical protein